MVASFDRLPPWPAVAGYVAFWLVASAVLHAGLRRSLARLAQVHPTAVNEVLAASLPRPVGIAVFLVALDGGLHALPVDRPGMAVVHRMLPTLLGVLGVATLMRIAFEAIDAYGRSNPALRSSSGIGKAATWIAGLAVVAVLVSDALGVSLAPALTALGVGSLAVALALQDTLSNFFSGLYLVVDKPVRLGDFIRVDPSYEGYVDSIGWRSTHLRTLNDNLVVIPNATLSKAIITNYSLPATFVASGLRVDVGGDVDLDRVEDVLADEAKRAVDLPSIAEAPAPSVVLAPGFVDGRIAFTVCFHVRSFGEQQAAQHALTKRIAARLKKEGIALAALRTSAVRRD